MQAFDPRPVRTATLQALLFLAVPGSIQGAQLLAARAGVAPLLMPQLPASSHAVLQLLGGFLTLIFAFLAHGVPHMLGLDLGKAARARWAIRAIGLLLAVELVCELARAHTAVVAARGLLVLADVAFLVLLLLARLPRRHDLLRAPAPVLAVALTLVPVGLALWTWEATGGPAGLASELLLYGAVVPVVLSMGFQMFSSLLRLPPANDGLFFVALTAWLLGASLRVGARVEPALAGLHAPLLLIGAALWIAALRGLRQRADRPLPASAQRSLLAPYVIIAALSLLLGAALGGWPRLGGHPLADDLARHLIGIGFALDVTMGVTLSVLPSFCRGRPSSTPLALFTLALVVLALSLRAGELLGWPTGSAAASALVSWLAVVLWALHLGRGLLPTAQPERA